ncbi:MAG TPA: hypothetical protein VJU15_04330 [Gemmatimonadales bacterium]|nr:hypothetical protein [Gemmatimonadales bacterium]
MQSSAELIASEQARGVKTLHLILLGAGVLVAVVFLMLVRLRGPILVPDAATPVIAYSSAGIALTAVAFAVLLVRGRIPERASSEGGNDYWSNGAVRGRSVLLWILCENAGIVSGTGFLLTGHMAPFLTQAVALMALAWFAPSRIAQA